MFVKRILLLIIPALLFLGCSKDTDVSSAGKMKWGVTKCYDDFLFCKYKSSPVTRTIDFEFNEYAQRNMNGDFSVALFKLKDDNTMSQVRDNEVIVYVNGEKTSNNVITVAANTTSVEVGLEFCPSAESIAHHWYFKPYEPVDLDRINGLDADEYCQELSSLLDILFIKKKVMNPLLKGLLIFLISILVALAVWLIILKPIAYPTFKAKSISFYDPVPYMSRCKIKGARLLVLTNDDKKVQSTLNRIFTGKIEYEKRGPWESDIVIMPKDKKSVRIRVPKEYLVDSRILKSGNEYNLQSISTNKITKIKLS